MQATFLSTARKAELMQALEKGDSAAISQLFTEIDRLENLVKTYEMGLEGAAQKLSSPTNKHPDEKPV